jgi:hypothetical protein
MTPLTILPSVSTSEAKPKLVASVTQEDLDVALQRVVRSAEELATMTASTMLLLQLMATTLVFCKFVLRHVASPCLFFANLF